MRITDPGHVGKSSKEGYGCSAGQAKDLNKLTVPGRRSSTTLKREGEDDGNNLSLDVPVNVFSKESIKKLSSKKPGDESKPEKKSLSTVTRETETKKTGTSAAPKVIKDDAKVQKKEPPPIDRSLKTEQKPLARPTVPVQQTMAPAQQMEGGILKPSQIKSSGFMPGNKQEKPQDKPLPAPVKSTLTTGGFNINQTPPPVAPAPQRRAQEPERRQAPGRLQQVKQQEQMPQQTFKGTADLENMDFVRRPTRPSQDNNAPKAPPAITVIPSTPKPTDVPVPSSPTHDIIVQKASVHKPLVKPMEPKNKLEDSMGKATEQKTTVPKDIPVETKEKSAEPKNPADKLTEPKRPADKPAESQKPADKPAEPKKPAELKDKMLTPKAPADKSKEQKPSTPPAATFQSNTSNKADEPLIGTEQKKGGWL